MANYRYFMTQRPPALGAMPKEGLIDIHEYDGKEYIEEIEEDAWAQIIYNRKLSRKELRGYELLPEFYDVKLTRSEMLAIMAMLEGYPMSESMAHTIANRLSEAKYECES